MDIIYSYYEYACLSQQYPAIYPYFNCVFDNDKICFRNINYTVRFMKPNKTQAVFFLWFIWYNPNTFACEYWWVTYTSLKTKWNI